LVDGENGETSHGVVKDGGLLSLLVAVFVAVAAELVRTAVPLASLELGIVEADEVLDLVGIGGDELVRSFGCAGPH
jgi:hypothetical protein